MENEKENNKEWKSDGFNDFSSGWINVQIPNGIISIHQFSHITDESTDEEKAQIIARAISMAKLVAAAPELLAAAQKAHHEFFMIGIEDVDGIRDTEILKSLNSAIKKATE